MATATIATGQRGNRDNRDTQNGGLAGILGKHLGMPGGRGAGPRPIAGVTPKALDPSCGV